MGFREIRKYLIECDMPDCGHIFGIVDLEEALEIGEEEAFYPWELDIPVLMSEHIAALRNGGWVFNAGELRCPACISDVQLSPEQLNEKSLFDFLKADMGYS